MENRPTIAICIGPVGLMRTKAASAIARMLGTKLGRQARVLESHMVAKDACISSERMMQTIIKQHAKGKCFVIADHGEVCSCGISDPDAPGIISWLTKFNIDSITVMHGFHQACIEASPCVDIGDNDLLSKDSSNMTKITLQSIVRRKAPIEAWIGDVATRFDLIPNPMTIRTVYEIFQWSVQFILWATRTGVSMNEMCVDANYYYVHELNSLNGAQRVGFAIPKLQHGDPGFTAPKSRPIRRAPPTRRSSDPPVKAKTFDLDEFPPIAGLKTSKSNGDRPASRSWGVRCDANNEEPMNFDASTMMGENESCGEIDSDSIARLRNHLVDELEKNSVLYNNAVAEAMRLSGVMEHQLKIIDIATNRLCSQRTINGV